MALGQRANFEGGLKMAWTVYRVDKDGPTVIGCTDELEEIGVIIIEDRDKIDWEPLGYDVIKGEN